MTVECMQNKAFSLCKLISSQKGPRQAWLIYKRLMTGLIKVFINARKKDKKVS